MKKVLLLGSTGSIGKSTENCIRRYNDQFELIGISLNRSVESAVEQIKEFSIPFVTIGSPESASQFPQEQFPKTTLFTGEEGLTRMAEELDYDILINALVGSVGFQPTAAALKRGKTVALANKETLVVGGELIADILAQYGGTLLPVDSEHSAIFQCLTGENESTIETMTITASGGPFRELPLSEFSNITLEKALKHPTWAMGAKITIDSSTLMNKGFEIIEAHHIFSIPYEKINVVVHPQSIIHSMVTFHDGSTMAQCGLPDMELPIQYAMTYPNRFPIQSKRLSLAEIGQLTFFKPDHEKFPCLNYCIESGKIGGTMPAVLNAANEVAVDLFLNKRIAYTDIAKIVGNAIEKHNREDSQSVEQIIDIDQTTRKEIYALYK